MITVHNGSDNEISFELTENCKNITSYGLITRIVIESNGVVADSAVNPNLFDWTQNRIDFKAGLAGFQLGTHNAVVKTYDSTNQNGIVWSDALNFRVV